MQSLPRDIRERIREKIDSLAENPRPHGVKALQGSQKGHLRLRVGEYRIVYRVEDDRLLVLVVAVGHRREVYRQAVSPASAEPTIQLLQRPVDLLDACRPRTAMRRMMGSARSSKNRTFFWTAWRSSSHVGLRASGYTRYRYACATRCHNQTTLSTA